MHVMCNCIYICLFVCLYVNKHCSYISKYITFIFILLDIIQHPTNDTFCAGSNALLNCVVFDNSTKSVANTTGWFINTNLPAAVSDSYMINNTRDGDVVTSVLTIENVSLNDNGTGYFCVTAYDIDSYIGVISVAGKHTYMYLQACLHTYVRIYVHAYGTACIIVNKCTYMHVLVTSESLCGSYMFITSACLVSSYITRYMLCIVMHTLCNA